MWVLLDALNEIGLGPEDISDIFMTHLHPDHMGGAINENGSAIFANANLKLLQEEHNYWTTKSFSSDEINGKDWSNLAKKFYLPMVKDWNCYQIMLISSAEYL